MKRLLITSQRIFVQHFFLKGECELEGTGSRVGGLTDIFIGQEFGHGFVATLHQYFYPRGLRRPVGGVEIQGGFILILRLGPQSIGLIQLAQLEMCPGIFKFAVDLPE